MVANVQIQIAQYKHRPGILHLAETVFNAIEPIEAALNCPWDEVKNGWEKSIDYVLQEPHSLVAIDEATGAVVGFSLSEIIQMDNYSGQSIQEWFPPGVLKDICDQVTESWASVFENAKCRKLFVIGCLCVSPEYAGDGLAKRMGVANLNLAKALGCTHSTCVCTNLYTQKAAEKLSFKEIGCLNYADLKDKRGNAPVVITDPVQKSVKWYIKEITHIGGSLHKPQIYAKL